MEVSRDEPKGGGRFCDRMVDLPSSFFLLPFNLISSFLVLGSSLSTLSTFPSGQGGKNQMPMGIRRRLDPHITSNGRGKDGQDTGLFALRSIEPSNQGSVFTRRQQCYRSMKRLCDSFSEFDLSLSLSLVCIELWRLLTPHSIKTDESIKRGDPRLREMDQLVPMFSRRLEIIRETGEQLFSFAEIKSLSNPSFTHILREARNSAVRLLQIVTEHFPSYRDESVWFVEGELHRGKRCDLDSSSSFSFRPFHPSPPQLIKQIKSNSGREHKSSLLIFGAVMRAKDWESLMTSTKLRCLPTIEFLRS